MNRTFVTGDTHQDIHVAKLFNFPHKVKDLDKTDVLIICGDAGFKWFNNINNHEENRLLSKIEKLPFSIFVVPGNHENYDVIEKLPIVEMYGGIVRIDPRYPSTVYAERGKVYTINSKTYFCMSGAYSIDKKNRKEFISWWKQELPTDKEFVEAEKVVEDNDFTFDYIITHDAPPFCTNLISKYYVAETASRKLHDFYTFLWVNANFEHWYCGHHHVDESPHEKITYLFQTIKEIENIEKDYSKIFDKI